MHGVVHLAHAKIKGKYDSVIIWFSQQKNLMIILKRMKLR